MHPEEFWWLAEYHRVPPDYGNLTEDEVREAYEELQRAEEQEAAKNAGH